MQRPRPARVLGADGRMHPDLPVARDDDHSSEVELARHVRLDDSLQMIQALLDQTAVVAHWDALSWKSLLTYRLSMYSRSR